MIACFAAWLRRTDELTAARAELQQLHKALSKEQLHTAGLSSDVSRLTKQNIALKQRADSFEAEAARLRADHTYVTAERCECGGDAELHWRKVAVTAEAQARQDRINAVAMADELERLRLKVDELERLERIAELERAGVVKVA